MSHHHFTTRVMPGPAVLMTTLPPARPAEVGWRSLTGLLPPDIDIREWIISPDSRYVVCYTAEMKPNGRQELYSVPMAGGPPVKLTPPLVAGGDIWRFVITPDSQFVVYTAHQEVAYRLNLYRVPITGGPALKLDQQLPAGGIGVGDFKIDPDNARVVYARDRYDQKAHFRLFSVPLGGGTPTPLHSSPAHGGDVIAFDIDPVRDRVIYVAAQDTCGRRSLFSVPIAGGPATKLTSPQLDVDNGFHLYWDTACPLVVFSAVSSDFTSAELYRASTDGSGSGLPTKLSCPLAPNETVIGYHLSPDGARVVYNVATSTQLVPTPVHGNLYAVSSRGGLSLLLSPTAAPGFGVYDDRFVITADSQRVVYERQHSDLVNPVLESVALNGADRKVLYARGGGEPLGEWHVSPHDHWVIYDTRPSYAAYSISASGGIPIPLGNGATPLFLADSFRVVYTSNQLSGTWDWDLYSQQITGGGLRNLSRVEDGASVADYAISPDGRWIVFRVCYPTGACELRVSDGAEAAPILFFPFMH